MMALSATGLLQSVRNVETGPSKALSLVTMVLELAAVLAVPLILDMLAQVRLLSVNINPTVAMEYDKLGKDVIMD